jgi:RHS repeat-associated protein
MTSVTGTEFGAYTMVYDDESRLKEVTYPREGGSATDYYLQYNALGQRMRATLNGTTWRYVYNGDRLLEETTNSGGAVSRYTTESGSYYAPWVHLTRDGGHRFPVYDGVGTARALVDTAGAVTDTYTLEAFGIQRVSTGTTVNPYRFGGAWGYMTEGSGLLQLGARFYWPEIGRFIQQDPIGEGMNWYGYAGNNPVTRVDPTGFEFDPVGWISEGIMQVFWDPVTVQPRGRLDPETARDLRAIRGGDPCWNARSATKNVLVAPMVGTGLAALSMAAPGGGGGGGRMVRVSRWGRPGLRSGDWVMRGGVNWPNYILSGKWQPGFGNQFAPFTSGRPYLVPGSSLGWPSGGILNPLKGLLGQRWYLP